MNKCTRTPGGEICTGNLGVFIGIYLSIFLINKVKTGSLLTLIDNQARPLFLLPNNHPMRQNPYTVKERPSLFVQYAMLLLTSN